MIQKYLKNSPLLNVYTANESSNVQALTLSPQNVAEQTVKHSKALYPAPPQRLWLYQYMRPEEGS